MSRTGVEAFLALASLQQILRMQRYRSRKPGEPRVPTPPRLSRLSCARGPTSSRASHLEQGFRSCVGILRQASTATSRFLRNGVGARVARPIYPSPQRQLLFDDHVGAGEDCGDRQDARRIGHSLKSPDAQPCDGSGRQWGGSGNTTAGQNRQCFYYSRHRTTARWISGSVPAVQNHHCRLSTRLPRVARSLADEQARVLVTVLRVFVLTLHQHTTFDPCVDDVLRLLLCRAGTEFLNLPAKRPDP